MKRKWVDFDITVLGLSLSGISSAKYLASAGANVVISEYRELKSSDEAAIAELKNIGIDVEMGGHKDETLLKSDMIITSPGIPPRAPVYKFINDNNLKTMSEIELAYNETNTPFIAITGTNGKTTTTKLVSEILEKAGYKAPFCGNIGVPPVSLLGKDIDYFVCELSSFQIDTSKTFRAQIACYLNYTADHVDWHGNEEAYYKAKEKLFLKYPQPMWSVFNARDYKVVKVAEKSSSNLVFFGADVPYNCVFLENGVFIYKSKNGKEKILNIQQTSLIGEHNYENIMAAISIAKIVGVDNQVIEHAVIDFKPPEHRLEFVADINGTKYYNDSKATNCDSTICALKAFKEKVVLIAGGRDKGTSLDKFVELVKEKVEKIILIGEASDRFEQELTAKGYNNIQRADSLEQAVDIAYELNCQNVLLSPACASYDMFKNFEERGRVFKEYVHKKQ